VGKKTNTPPPLVSRVHIRLYRQSQETRRKSPAEERYCRAAGWAWHHWPRRWAGGRRQVPCVTIFEMLVEGSTATASHFRTSRWFHTDGGQ